MSAAPNRFKQANAPKGLELVALALQVQGRTCDRDDTSRESRPARPRVVHAVTSVGALA